MVEEHFTVVVLPYTCAPRAKFHVSLHISPDLTPDGETSTLEKFKRFKNWAKELKNRPKVVLHDRDGPIRVKPLLTPLAPDLWEDLFPLDTPVRERSKLEWSERFWRTFRAAELHIVVKILHAAAIYASPIRPPAPSAHPFNLMIPEIIDSIADALTVIPEKKFIKKSIVDTNIVEITSNLDWLTSENPENRKSLEDLEERIDGSVPSLRFARQLHRARRFYERPEAIAEYSEYPTGDVQPRPEIPQPDFHERCTLISDHPSLQRQLGLVLDLRVLELERLSKSQWLGAHIELRRFPGDVCSPMRTRCTAIGDDLISVPENDDWCGGRLRLGNDSLYALLDLDPDGSALKLDRFLWSFPRLFKSELNQDPVHAAPSSLRSIGFTVVRNRKALDTQQKLGRQEDLYSQLSNSSKAGKSVAKKIKTAPLLSTEDINQGLRIEVWDDEVRSWFSLHRRQVDVMVNGEVVTTGSSEEGFLQGTTATETPDVDESPVHVHESIFGWEGWSLSAPRPGKRVRHQDGEELVEETTLDTEPATPLSVTSSVEPRTLPRLRYGRSYAFRAWGVDLAGNSREHKIVKVKQPSAGTVNAVKDALKERKPHPDPVAGFEALVREQTVGLAARTGQERSPITVDLAALEGILSPVPEADREVLSRLRSLRVQESQEPPTIKLDRESLVANAFSSTLADDSQPMIVDTAVVDAKRLAHAVAQSGSFDLRAVVDMFETVTPLKPFLRWDPVQPPAVVARHAFSSAESLRQLVIRSGVSQDLETLEITVTPPEVYGPAHSSLRYRVTSERHLVPPKTSQTEAELHGAFDSAIGSPYPAKHLPMLAVALREAGTFFDTEVPRLDDPSQRDPQVGIDLANDPGVDPGTLLSLPLDPGQAPATGQYVIHDTDQLVLPYLPDCAGHGISFVFQEAGRDRMILPLFAREGFTARYPGDWPEFEPFRLVLYGTNQLTGALEGNAVNIGLPPGDVQRFRLASSLDRADLDIFGLWRSLPEAIRDNADVAEAVTDGWLWAFTPFDDVTLVHAVPRPLVAPTPTRLHAWRPAIGATAVLVVGAVTVDGPSTDSLALEARWTDPVDDLSMPAPFELDQQGIAFTTKIRPEEDLAVLGRLPDQTEDMLVIVPGAGRVWIHLPEHKIGDTKHRTVHYRFRASTRFREYFDPETIAPPVSEEPAGAGIPKDDGQSVVGPEVTVSVPSSAMPAAPIVHSVLPLFRWDEGTEPEQPMAVRRRRRAGVRIYLERPWFSSGEDELLGVLIAPTGDDTVSVENTAPPVTLDKIVSQWGADPVWLGAPVLKRALYLELDNLLRAIGLEDEPCDALPVVPPATYHLESDPHKRRVTVLGYRPQFSEDRNMWYVDVAIDPGKTFWPFVRLSVVRYQPDSKLGCHLSEPVRCDFVQLTPERTTSVSRTDIRHVRVVLSGPVGIRTAPEETVPDPVLNPQLVAKVSALVTANRRVTARLQRRDPEIPTDLGWENIKVVELAIRGFGKSFFEVAWVGELEAPEDLPLQRPGGLPEWRVVVEEWERLPGDPEDLKALLPLVWEQRLIFADEIII
jgi:hypothetical protein